MQTWNRAAFSHGYLWEKAQKKDWKGMYLNVNKIQRGSGRSPLPRPPRGLFLFFCVSYAFFNVHIYFNNQGKIESYRRK